MKKAFVIGSLLVVLTLSLGGSVASKSADGSATAFKQSFWKNLAAYRFQIATSISCCALR